MNTQPIRDSSSHLLPSPYQKLLKSWSNANAELQASRLGFENGSTGAWWAEAQVFNLLGQALRGRHCGITNGSTYCAFPDPVGTRSAMLLLAQPGSALQPPARQSAVEELCSPIPPKLAARWQAQLVLLQALLVTWTDYTCVRRFAGSDPASSMLQCSTEQWRTFKFFSEQRYCSYFYFFILFFGGETTLSVRHIKMI